MLLYEKKKAGIVLVYVVRAFLKRRELVATLQGLATRLDALEAKLEEKTEALAMLHDTFSRNMSAPLTLRFRYRVVNPVKRLLLVS